MINYLGEYRQDKDNLPTTTNNPVTKNGGLFIKFACIPKRNAKRKLPKNKIISSNPPAKEMCENVEISSILV